MDDIMDGVQTYRNPMLVNVLSKLGYIENFGTGIPRILEAYRGKASQPAFKATDNFFFLTLPGLNYMGDPVNDPVKFITEPLNDFGVALLKFIRNNPGLNAREITDSMKKEHIDEISYSERIRTNHQK